MAEEQPPVPAGATAERCPSCKRWYFIADVTQGIKPHMLVDASPVGPNNGDIILVIRYPRRPLAYVERNPGRLFGKTLVYTDHGKTCAKSAHQHRTRSRTS